MTRISTGIDRLTNGADSGARLALLESWLHQLTAVCPWVTHCTSRCLSFFLCKMRIVMILGKVVVRNT